MSSYRARVSRITVLSYILQQLHATKKLPSAVNTLLKYTSPISQFSNVNNFS